MVLKKPAKGILRKTSSFNYLLKNLAHIEPIYLLLKNLAHIEPIYLPHQCNNDVGWIPATSINST
jgi:hypothetical protein